MDVKARRASLYLLDSLSDGFIALDENWRYIYINSAAERLIGRSRSSLLGKEVWKEFPHIAGTAVEGELRRAANDQVAIEFEVHQEVRGRWLWHKAHPLPRRRVDHLLPRHHATKTGAGSIGPTDDGAGAGE